MHSGRSVNQTFSDFKKYVGILHGFFPDAKLYSVSVVHAPRFVNDFEKEYAYNEMIKENAVKNRVIVGDWNGVISESGKSCFHTDAIHPNETGYGLFKEFIKNLVSV